MTQCGCDVEYNADNLDERWYYWEVVADQILKDLRYQIKNFDFSKYTVRPIEKNYGITFFPNLIVRFSFYFFMEIF